MRLTDRQWELIEPLLPATLKAREALEGLRLILNAPFLKGFYGNFEAGLIGRRFAEALSSLPDLPQMDIILAKDWRIGKILFTLANMALEQGKLGLYEGFIDAAFAPAKKGRHAGKNEKGEGAKIMAIAEAQGYPIALYLYIDSASPGEAALAENAVAAKIIDASQTCLIGAKACGSDGLDEKLAEKRLVEMIAPNRRNRPKNARRQIAAPL